MKLIVVAQIRAPLLLRVVGLYGLLFAFMVPSFVASAQETHQLAAAQETPVVQAPALPTRQLVSGYPASMAIARLGIDLPIAKGTYTSSTTSWTLSDDKAQFAVDTIQPNDSHGITLLYGHNTMAVFKPLRGLRAGDKLVIKTKNNHTFVYRYTNDTVVDPTNLSVLYEQSLQPKVALITCSGIWSETRRVMYFNLVEVS